MKTITIIEPNVILNLEYNGEELFPFLTELENEGLITSAEDVHFVINDSNPKIITKKNKIAMPYYVENGFYKLDLF